MRKLHAAKLTMGGILAILSLGTLLGLLYLGAMSVSEDLQPLAVPIEIVGPGGAAVYFGVVDVAEATPYSALRAAAQEGNFTVRTVDYGDRVYVDEIAGHAASGGAGWIFGVGDGDDGALCYPNVASDAYALREGHRVEWRWSEDSVAVTSCS